MRLSVSNIALPAYDHLPQLAAVRDAGFSGLEVAPSRVWRETWKGLTSAMVRDYRRHVEGAGLRVVGLHSLLFDHPELGLFGDAETRGRTLEFIAHLSAVCRDLGGRTLVWGGGRRLGACDPGAAVVETLDFLERLDQKMKTHGTCLCFEPLGPGDTRFINSVHESIDIVQRFDRPTLRVQIDAKALMENDEVEADVFRCAKPYLVHFHANDPGLGVLGPESVTQHQRIGEFLRDIGYRGFVSLEQVHRGDGDGMDGIAKSARILKQCYQS